jgi:hypothetical protein
VPWGTHDVFDSMSRARCGTCWTPPMMAPPLHYSRMRTGCRLWQAAQYMHWCALTPLHGMAWVSPRVRCPMKQIAQPGGNKRRRGTHKYSRGPLCHCRHCADLKAGKECN